MHKLFPALLIVGMIAINVYFAWGGLSALSTVTGAVDLGAIVAPASYAAAQIDLEPPAIRVERPEMNATIWASSSGVVIGARVVVEDNEKPDSLWVSLARPVDGSGTILRGSLGIEVGADEVENWPEPKIDISREGRKTVSSEGNHIVEANVSYVGENVCIVDLNLTIEDPTYYGLDKGGTYWLIFVAGDKNRNFAWNSSLINLEQSNTKTTPPNERFVTPAGSITPKHPALSFDTPYIPYLTKDGQYYVVDKVYDLGRYVYKIQFNILAPTNNISVTTAKGPLTRFTHTSPSFLAGFLILINEGEQSRLNEFVGWGYVEFASSISVRFDVGAWSPLLSVYMLLVYAWAALFAWGLTLRLKRRSKRAP